MLNVKGKTAMKDAKDLMQRTTISTTQYTGGVDAHALLMCNIKNEPLHPTLARAWSYLEKAACPAIIELNRSAIFYVYFQVISNLEEIEQAHGHTQVFADGKTH